MKRNYYQTSAEIEKGIYLYCNHMNKTFLFMDQYAHDLYEECLCIDEMKKENEELFNALCNNEFILPDDVDERAIVEFHKQLEQHDRSMYHIVINPTLSCNLCCWYCYESKIPNSRMNIRVLEGIKKHIVRYYDECPFKVLKLSFFGGEPFICFDIVEDLCKYAYKFCNEKGINFLLDITTNGTLLTRERILLLSPYNSSFQITLDGNREQHNKVKYENNRSVDTYEKTLNGIKMIEHFIPNSYVFVRINFDRNTLLGFDSILADIDDLQRDKTTIILKKIWQVKKETISKNLVFTTIEKLFDHNFMVDYYNQGKLCFAERLNQLVINYDGLVFKCTTIDRFNKENSFGFLDETGNVYWDSTKLARVSSNLQLDCCKTCRSYPDCYGPCNMHIFAGTASCYMDSLNLSHAEYLMFQYKQTRQVQKMRNKNIVDH